MSFLVLFTEIIERMLKYEREVEALNIVYTFNVQDKYPPQSILKSFLNKSDEILKRKRTEAEDLSAVVVWHYFALCMTNLLGSFGLLVH